MPFNTINNVYKNVKQVDEDLSQGHVSVQETSKAVNDIKKTWDDFAKIGDYRDKYGNKQNKLADFAKKEFVPGTFDAFGGIKNGAATGISSVSSFFSAVSPSVAMAMMKRTIRNLLFFMLFKIISYGVSYCLD